MISLYGFTALRMTNQRNRLIRLFFLLCCSLPLTGCLDRLLYLPDDEIEIRPDKDGYHFQSLFFNAYDGTRLHGWFVKAQGVSSATQAKGTVIFLHDTTGNIATHWEQIAWVPQRGFNVFTFDYRGFGRSDGHPDMQGLLKDSQRAIELAQDSEFINSGKLVIFAQGTAASNAIALVASGAVQNIRALATESAFISYFEYANDFIPWLGFFTSNALSADNYIHNVSPVPLLLIHGTADQWVDYRHARQLYALARQPKTLLTVNNGGYLEAMDDQHDGHYRDRLIQFFEQALQQPLPNRATAH